MVAEGYIVLMENQIKRMVKIFLSAELAKNNVVCTASTITAG